MQIPESLRPTEKYKNQNYNELFPEGINSDRISDQSYNKEMNAKKAPMNDENLFVLKNNSMHKI